MINVRRNPEYFIMAIGAVLIAVGVMRGEVAVVLSKAIRVCLECIGVG